MLEKVLRTGSFEDPASRVERILSAQEPVFAAAFSQAVRQIRNQFTIGRLADLLESGAFEEALERLEDAASALGVTAAEQVTASAAAAATALSGALVVPIRFDVTNERAVQAIRQERVRLAREFTSEQRQVVTETLADGVTRGLNPRDQARLFKNSIGLTSGQLRQVQNFRRLLEEGSSDVFSRNLRDRRFDRTIRGAQAAGRVLTGQEIDRMVNRYRERTLAFRSRVIARTEALRSANQGNHLLYSQAAEAGQIPGDFLIRTWRTARDSRVRDSHSSIEGQTILGLETRFTTGNGNSLLYPGDPGAPASDVVQCRCSVATRVFQTLEGLQGFLAQRGLSLAA